MNQGKLEVVKQEMARVNISMLRISKLRWTGMGEFNSDDYYIYYCALVLANTLSTTQEKTTHGHHQMVDTKIRLVIFFAAKDVEALYSQQK